MKHLTYLAIASLLKARPLTTKTNRKLWQIDLRKSFHYKITNREDVKLQFSSLLDLPRDQDLRTKLQKQRCALLKSQKIEPAMIAVADGMVIFQSFG